MPVNTDAQLLPLPSVETGLCAGWAQSGRQFGGVLQMAWPVNS